MTEAAKLREGDRVRLEGTVVDDQPTGKMVLLFNGARPADFTYVSTSALANATVLPRELKVGDWVIWGQITGYKIALIKNGRAAVFTSNGDLSRYVLDLSDLSLDPDHKEEGE